MTFIYALLDPRTDRVRYVGQSIDPWQRRYDHLKNKGRTHKVHWLQQLVRAGLQPTLVVLETCSAQKSDWEEREIDWITFYRSIGEPLTNMTDGGGGFTGRHTSTTRLKISNSRRGHRDSVETRQKKSKASSSRRHTTQSRALIADITKAAWASRTGKMRCRPRSQAHQAKLTTSQNRKWACNECALVSTAAGITTHQTRWSNHQGRTSVDVESRS